MKTINQNEIYTNLSGYLKTRGIELKEGSYAQNIKTGCDLLTDAINLGQKGLRRAKTETEKTLDQMRQIIHDKTAPPQPAEAPKKPKAKASKTAAPKARTTKRPKPGAK